MPGVVALLSIEDARTLILQRVRPLDAELVPLAAAAGRVLAEGARAAVDLPPFASSSMDGFAVRACDVPGRLHVADESAAGRPASRELRPREAIAVATGAVVPAEADAVDAIEYVVQNENEIEVPAPVAAGANIRMPAGDVRAGDVVVPARTRLAPRHLAALAASGVAAVVCSRRPAAAVVATGSELRRPGEELRHGEIYESNTALLMPALESAGAAVVSAVEVADDERSHRDALARALEADVAATTGGGPVGVHDIVRRVTTELGVEEAFSRAAV